MNWPALAFLIAAYLVWSLAWFLIYTRRLNRLSAINERFSHSAQKQHSDESEYAWLVQRTSEFHRLIKEAGVPDSSVAYVEPLGLGQLVRGHASASDNWLAIRAETIGWTYRAIQQAAGVYMDRRMQSLNPLHWLLMLVTLPQHLISYIGFRGDSSLGRFLNVVWTVLLGIAAITGFTIRNILGS